MKKLSTSISLSAIAALLGGGLLLLAPERSQAQIGAVAISATAFLQNSSNDNGTNTTTKAPGKNTTLISTARLTSILIKDETAEGNWSSTRGTLVYDYNIPGFALKQGANEQDVSDILSISASGDNDINAGSYNDNNGQGSPPDSSTDYQLTTLTFDDSSVSGGAGLTFSVTGLGVSSQKAINFNANTGNYTQSFSVSLGSGTGEGTYQSTPLVVTGFALTVSGSATENNGGGTGGDVVAPKKDATPAPAGK
jgi:hypothetical protein